MGGNRIPFSQTEGRRPVGRPKHRWIDAVARGADTLLKIKRWTSIAKDREKWRRMIMEAKVRLQTTIKLLINNIIITDGYLYDILCI